MAENPTRSQRALQKKVIADAACGTDVLTQIAAHDETTGRDDRELPLVVHCSKQQRRRRRRSCTRRTNVTILTR